MFAILFSNELARRTAGNGITSNAVHPGAVATHILRDEPAPVRWLTGLFFGSPEKGARTTVHLASAPEVANTTGGYFIASKPASQSAAALDEPLAARLWERSVELCGLKEA